MIAPAEHTHMGCTLTAHRVVWPRRLRWVRPWPPRMTFDWQELRHVMRSFKIRWGWALLLAIVLVPAVGEWGPAASAIATLP